MYYHEELAFTITINKGKCAGKATGDAGSIPACESKKKGEALLTSGRCASPSDPRSTTASLHSFLSQGGLIQSRIAENQRILGFGKGARTGMVFQSTLWKRVKEPAIPREGAHSIDKHSFDSCFIRL